MERETLVRVNKAAYIVFIVIAALTAVAAMVFGMLDMTLPSYTAAGCACIVAGALLFHMLNAGQSKRR